MRIGEGGYLNDRPPASLRHPHDAFQPNQFGLLFDASAVGPEDDHTPSREAGPRLKTNSRHHIASTSTKVLPFQR